MKKLHVSMGNMKLGKGIGNISLPPGITCPKDAPCQGAGCYAMKAWRCYPSARKAWMENWKLWQAAPDLYAGQLAFWLEKKTRGKQPLKYFRFHVAGDIPSQQYFDMMRNMARVYPEVKFLVFTKRYGLDFDDTPENLTVVFSRWPGYFMPGNLGAKFPQAWLDDPKRKDAYMPSTARKCPGSCTKCHRCWDMKPGDHVKWHIH